jgi:hypothetical protein
MRWQCSARHPQRQFSIKVGTLMEDSPIGLDKMASRNMAASELQEWRFQL